MRYLLLAVFICATLITSAQGSSSYEKYVNKESLRKHLTIIAGEEMQGRETGTEGQRKAAAYIESQFKNNGLNMPGSMKAYQQEYPLIKDSLTRYSFEVDDYKAQLGNDFILPLRENLSSTKIKTSKIAFAGYGIESDNYNDYKNLNPKGKLLIIFTGEPKADGKYIISNSSKPSDWTYPGLAKKARLAAEKGAVGVLFINPLTENFNPRLVESSKKTQLYYPRKNEYNRNSWYASITHAFAKRLLGNSADSLLMNAKNWNTFSKSDYVTKDAKTKIEIEKEKLTTIATNVLGVIEGTDKRNEYVFVTAHYDHLGMRDGKIYYGADDDGSGTCAVITMAEAFAKAKAEGNGPRRTMVFMTVSGEEKGLWGSEFYSDNPVFPLDKTSVDLNIDMIGRVDTERKLGDTLNYVYVVGHDKLSTELPKVNETINKRYTNLTLDYKFDDPNDPERIYFRSDHYNFARKGVPVLFFYDGMLKSDYHKPTDTVDKIYWDLYEKRARMIFHTAWEMANRDAMLVIDLPIPTDER